MNYMRFVKRVALFVLIVFLSIPALGQSVNRRGQKFLDKSKEALAQRDWRGAVEYMERAIDADDENPVVYLEKADMFYKLNQLDTVYNALHNAFTLNESWPNRFTDYYFVYGNESFKKGKYEQAERPLSIYADKGYRQDYVELAGTLLKSVKFAQTELDKKREPKEVKALNTQNIFRSVYFPFFTLEPNQLLYFTGQRTNSLEEGIYRAQIDGETIERIEEVPVINTRENEGAAAVSADGRVMVFTSCNRRDGFGSCDLYISYREGRSWSKPENLGASINSRAWESQPCLSSDGRTLIFSSNRKGGVGKRDLYIAKKSGDGWSNAQNLGPVINTITDEISPYLYFDDKTLFFASNGKVGMGGFDIYKVNYLTKDDVQNVGLPINTNRDEISFHKSFSGTVYFSREAPVRPPESTIYFFEDSAYDEEEIKLVYGNVIAKNSQKPVQAEVEIFDLAKDSLIHVTYSDSQDGNYSIVVPEKSEYAFYVAAKGYLFESKQLQVGDDNKYQLDFSLTPIAKGEAISLNNIYFEFDSYKLNEKSKNEILKIKEFLSQNPAVKIEIAGYTDQKGSAAYNLKLSEQRAKSVYEELMKRKVEAGRVSYKGYGESQSTGEQEENRVVKVIVR